MEEKDKDWWVEFRNRPSSRISRKEADKVSELHAKYFNHRKVELCSCNPKQAQKYINDLNKLYES